ncbi:hypothetical protein EMIHUDRAFT_470296, partial [Emiliania huxleyi CCMP1516]|uniref:Tetratricopeptide repeat protein n=2 Tax=Emiliania huxleyi TaxID=2903 RepID=A0A0D3J185_EMIH1
MLSLFLASPSASPSPAPVRIRVCTMGGEGMCSVGAGDSTLAALRFLAPRDGVVLNGCSCLARCDRGVVLQLTNTGEFVERVNDAASAADVLRRAGAEVDPRLIEAYGTGERGSEHDEEGRLTEALDAYGRAVRLALAAGLGPQWRSLPSSVLRVRERRGRAGAPTAEQAAWLVQLLVRRSRVYTGLSGQGWVRSRQRALEDAQQAVQLLTLLDAVLPDSRADAAAARLSEESRALAWARDSPRLARRRPRHVHDPSATPVSQERLAEAHEALRDISGAILAYEQLLRIEPPDDPRLAPPLAELVLISHRRGLADAAEVREGLQQGLQQVEQVSRETLTRRALEDVESLRRVVDEDIGLLERAAAEYEIGTGRGPRSSFASRAMRDLGTLRKVAFSDINTLQLQILRGDPTDLEELASLSAGDVAPGQQAYWLRAQFETGALPRDPLFVRNLVEQARRDPRIVSRLVADMAANTGGAPPAVEPGPDGADDPAGPV